MLDGVGSSGGALPLRPSGGSLLHRGSCADGWAAAARAVPVPPLFDASFSERTIFQGAYPPYLAEDKTAADGGIDWYALGIVSRAVAAGRCILFCGLWLVRVGPGTIRSRFSPSALGVGSGPVDYFSSRRPRPPCPDTTPQHRSTNRFDSPGQ